MDLKSRSKVKTEFSMSSMTDLIFLLLIFFIITSTMVNPNAIKLLLPKGDAQVKAPDPIEVAIDADLKVYVSGKETSYERLQSDLEKELSGKDREQVSLALSPDRSVPVEYVVRVMSTANSMKLRMIIRTEK